MNVALIGYGKMGKEIEKVLIERGHRISLIIDADNRGQLDAAHLAGADAAIEFSTPAAAFDNIVRCLECGVPVVCGTTAWLDRMAEAKRICTERNGAFFYASNYSIGVNLMFRVNEMLARLMNRFPEYDVTIEETHHTQKKDAPSGTAITLAEGILAEVERKTKWTEGATTVPSELGIASIRRSVVPGIHTVTYESEADVLTIAHQAKSRRGFALGAVIAAEFLRDKKGIYSMNDLLK
ncbi:MAG: 4-hydroxy-tetrahydrodipicolinate reductase [Rikenellaceae bacterium]|nr:4-hydroxy-tetrahydrodipicolinate reductase [Rikenellaceae bacterium]